MARKMAILFLLAFGFNILVLGIVWIHHNMVTGLNPFLGPIFALLQLLLLAGIIWAGGRYLIGYLRKFIVFSPAMLFMLGAVIMATTFIVDEFLFGRSLLAPARSHPGDARVYVRLLFAVLFLVLAGAYHFFPVIAHRTLNPTLGYIHFWITLACAYLLAYPEHYVTLAAMPRRYIDYSPWPRTDFYTFTHNTELILLAAQGLFLVNLFNSTGKKVQI